ncbi:hypothetical protein L914_06683 [Phytophthora nicotianae]|uniref:RxLR effector protein n=1 Tax=Phytophthora nicotianae TaxID=4792 RepID=W2NME3_PHYNI|nr:hypothetical protein L914_06683 [Phytophthora nicotianae]
MHLTYAVLATGIALFVSTDIVSTAQNTAKNLQQEAPLVVHSGSQKEINYGKRLLRTTVQTYDGDEDSDERMFAPMINGLLGKVGPVIELGGPKVVKDAPKLEKYQVWLRARLSPPQVQRVLSEKKKPLQALNYILRSQDSDQYLKFVVEYHRRRPGSTIPKPASQMQNYELWLYAGLTPSQVQSRVNVLSAKKKPLQALSYILRSKESDQYLKFIVEYQRRQPRSKIPKPVSQMQSYEVWLYAGLNPSQVRVDVLKKEPWQALRSILRGKDSDQYLKFVVDYQRSQPGSKISKPAAQMQKSELWLHAGLTPTQVRVNILKTTLRGVEQHKLVRQFNKFEKMYERRNQNTAVSPI